MSEKQTNLSSNIAGVLFSKNTPVSLRLYMANDKCNLATQPFEIISYDDGQLYYVARLSLGGQFYERDILLKLYDNDDQAFIHLIESVNGFKRQKLNPFPRLMSFDADDSINTQTFSPLFYCITQGVFFHPHCEVCQAVMTYNPQEKTVECKFCIKLAEQKIQYSIDAEDEVKTNDALVSLVKSQGNLKAAESDMPCIRCANNDECYITKEDGAFVGQALENLLPFSLKSFSLVAFEYTPLTLLEFSYFAGGMNVTQFRSILAKQNDDNRLVLLSDTLSAICRDTYITVIESINTKLAVFLKICDLALSLEEQGLNSDSFLNIKNLRVELNSSKSDDIGSFSATPSLLPLSTYFSSDKHTEFETAKLHIQNILQSGNNENSVFEVLLQNEDDKNIPVSPGDILKFKISNEIMSFVVKQKKHQRLILESVEYLSTTAESVFVDQFYNGTPEVVEYLSIDEIDSVSGFQNLSHVLLTMLLSNSVLGEDEITHASNIMFSKLQKVGGEELTENHLNTVIHTTPALSVVFRQENTLYKPEINRSELIPDVYWLQLLGVAIQLSGNVYGYYSERVEVDSVEADSVAILRLVKNDIANILKAINQSSAIFSVRNVDEVGLIRSALEGIVDDTRWLDSALLARGKENRVDSNVKVDMNLDKTNVFASVSSSKNVNFEVDKTLIMRKKK